MPPRRHTDEDGEEVLAEFYGWVSFVPGEDEAEPGDLTAKADFTDVTAADNPDWKIDLNDDVIGGWRADGGRGGDVTLVWGLPLVRGAVAATAELDGEADRPGAGRRRPLHPGRGRRGARLRRRLFLAMKLWDRQRAASSPRRASTPRARTTSPRTTSPRTNSEDEEPEAK